MNSKIGKVKKLEITVACYTLITHYFAFHVNKSIITSDFVDEMRNMCSDEVPKLVPATKNLKEYYEIIDFCSKEIAESMYNLL